MKVVFNSRPKKILVRGTNWLGDCVLTIPFLERLRTIFPDAEIVIAVREPLAELFEFVPALNRIYRIQSTISRAALIGALREERFDLAILLPNAFEAAWLAWRAEIPARWGYATDGRSFLLTHAVPLDPPVLAKHQVHYYLDLLRQLGLIHENPCIDAIDLRIDETLGQAARERLRTRGVNLSKKILAISPGSRYGRAKQWLPERYAALADRAFDDGKATVLILGALAERALAESIAAQMRNRPWVLSGETSLKELMGLLACTNLFVCNDSGAMHLAAALGTPTLALFGSTNENATRPLGRRATVLKKPVSCRPCLLRECPIDFRCMRELTVDEVWAQAQVMLDGSI